MEKLDAFIIYSYVLKKRSTEKAKKNYDAVLETVQNLQKEEWVQVTSKQRFSSVINLFSINKIGWKG